VIDPEIGDELRVTVVATGLGDSNRKPLPVMPAYEQPMTVVRNGTTGEVESGYSEVDETAHHAESGEATNAGTETSDMFSSDVNIDYLDIPSFLRNQAD